MGQTCQKYEDDQDEDEQLSDHPSAISQNHSPDNSEIQQSNYSREHKILSGVQNKSRTKKNGEPYEFNSGAVYEGEWQSEMRHGYGKQVWPDGAEYEGQWVNDKVRFTFLGAWIWHFSACRRRHIYWTVRKRQGKWTRSLLETRWLQVRGPVRKRLVSRSRKRNQLPRTVYL